MKPLKFEKKESLLNIDVLFIPHTNRLVKMPEI
jgi:hypothetical protein